MIQLLITNIFRILKDKRLFVVAIFHFCIFTLVLSHAYTSLGVTYLGDGAATYQYLLKYESDPDITILESFMGAADITIASMIYVTFFFADDKRDKVFENMCTIYRDRTKVLLANYITLCFVGFIFTFFKLMGALIINLAYGNKVILVEGSFNYLGFLMWFLIFAAFMAVFYAAYMLTSNIYVPIVMLFSPLTISFCSRFMSEVPFGDKLLNYSVMFLTAPTLGYRLDEWSVAKRFIVPIVAGIVVLLTITSIVTAKRDIK